MKSSVIKLESVVKTYTMGETENVNAVDDVSLNIDEGEFVAIVGPSGSGKSTLMHIIGLLDKPTSGQVFLMGKETSKLNDNELAALRNEHIGFVFQSFNLLPRTSALDNVLLPLIYSQKIKSNRSELALAALETVGLGERANHKPSQLSGGQQQRVAIARALINDPDLILADEPTGNLDSKSGHEILDLFKKLNSNGNTVVLVTHDLGIAAEAKRTIRIVDGKIVKQ